MKKYPLEALVIGSGVTALGTLRCLTRVGVACRVASNGLAQFRRSRWWRSAPMMAGGLSEYLHNLHGGPMVLIPCSDDLLRSVACLPADLRERYRAAVPPLSVVDRFLDKGLFSLLLQELGVPHPRTIGIDGDFKPGQWDDSSRFFVKPRNSLLFQRHFGVKAFLPASVEDLLKKVELARGVGLEVLLQEYVPGLPSDHYFLDGFMDVGGRIRALFVRRRLRMFPPHFGNSSYLVSIPRMEAAQAVENLTRLLGAAGYRGIFSAEFKKDERDGVFRILEVNIRPWWFVEFAATCGVNVVEMAYRDSIGLPVDDVKEYKVGKRFIHPYFDVSACLEESPGRIRGLMKFLTSLPGADQPVFRLDDPLPAVEETWRLLKGFVGRRLPGVSTR